jgi:hypothetical protein
MKLKNEIFYHVTVKSWNFMIVDNSKFKWLTIWNKCFGWVSISFVIVDNWKFKSPKNFGSYQSIKNWFLKK